MTLLAAPVRPALALFFILGGVARAGETSSVRESVQQEAPRNYLNLRVGATTSSRHPALCLEVAPLEFLSLEGCGNGSGFLHQDAAPEVAHFRSWVKLTSWKTEWGWLQPRVGAGFAELQVGEDSGGFDFGGVGPLGTATAGPEVGASLRWLLPVVGGLELVGELGLSAAWFQHAPKLVAPQGSFQPSASLSLGVGF